MNSLIENTQCKSCGAVNSMTSFSNNTIQVASDIGVITVEHVVGEACRVCDEVFYDKDSEKRIQNASDQLLETMRQVPAVAMAG